MFSLADPPPVLFMGGDDALLGTGVADTVSAALPSLAGAVARSLADAGGDAIVAGAVPFDPGAAAHLVRPASVTRDPQAVRGWSGAVARADGRPSTANETWEVIASPSRLEYTQMVGVALACLFGDRGPADLRKVVLAREILVRTGGAIDPRRLLARLAVDPQVTCFVVPLPPARPSCRPVLVGATPELLIEKRGSLVGSTPLAGSARRSPHGGDADAAAARALAASVKDRREHACVVEWIADRLTPYCRSLVVPREPSLTATRTMWHLATAIRGDLRDPAAPSLDLLAAVHPTPAVCGQPFELARKAIASLEPFDRRYFAGAVGWCDAAGDGRWHVAIRCAELCGGTARLFAGAGIIADSDPAGETDETSAKLLTLLDALGIDEQGRPSFEARP